MKECSKIFLVIIIFIVSINNGSFNAHAGITTISSAINEAGRQRMLTQRMLKFYAMIGIDIDVGSENSLQQLNNEMALFTKQLEELKKFYTNEQIAHGLDVVAKLWLPYKKMLTKPVSRKNAEWLLSKNDELLLASHNVVLLLHDFSGTNYTKLVNVSGKQRMLSQMLAKMYMFKVWGFNNEESIKLTNQAKLDFKTALSELINAKENTESISRALNEVRIEWELFEFGLEKNTKKSIPLIVAMMSEKILIKMDKITSMYEKLSRIKGQAL